MATSYSPSTSTRTKATPAPGSTDPAWIDVEPTAATVPQIRQIAYEVPEQDKVLALLTLLNGVEAEAPLILLFRRRQDLVDRLTYTLRRLGLPVAGLHGRYVQAEREATVAAFRRGEIRLLIVTNLLARGIDVPSITHVINYGLPMKAEDYVHRIGRTGRAGRSGTAVTLAEHRERGKVRAIEAFTRQQIVASVIPGARSPEQARANAAAGSLELPASFQSQVRELYDRDIRPLVHDRW